VLGLHLARRVEDAPELGGALRLCTEYFTEAVERGQVGQSRPTVVLDGDVDGTVDGVDGNLLATLGSRAQQLYGLMVSLRHRNFKGCQVGQMVHH